MDSDWIALLLFLLMAAELLLYYLYPRGLAPLAFIPFGKPVHVQLNPRERDALMELDQEESGYRERRPQRLALERLGEQRIHTSRFIAWISPARGNIVARATWRFGGRGMGLIRVRMETEADTIRLTARQLPCPATLFLLVILLVARNPIAPTAAVLAICVGVMILFPRGVLKSAQEESITHLRSMLRAESRESKKRKSKQASA